MSFKYRIYGGKGEDDDFTHPNDLFNTMKQMLNYNGRGGSFYIDYSLWVSSSLFHQNTIKDLFLEENIIIRPDCYFPCNLKEMEYINNNEMVFVKRATVMRSFHLDTEPFTIEGKIPKLLKQIQKLKQEKIALITEVKKLKHEEITLENGLKIFK